MFTQYMHWKLEGSDTSQCITTVMYIQWALRPFFLAFVNFIFGTPFQWYPKKNHTFFEKILLVLIFKFGCQF